MWDRPPRRCIFKSSIGPPVMSVSTPLCVLRFVFFFFFLFSFFLQISFFFRLATVARCPPSVHSASIGRETPMPHETRVFEKCRTPRRYDRQRESPDARRLEIIRARRFVTDSRANHPPEWKSLLHSRSINYEYRPEDCSLSGVYPFRREGRGEGGTAKRGKEFAFRGDSTARSFLAMTAMIDKRQRERRNAFSLKRSSKKADGSSLPVGY